MIMGILYGGGGLESRGPFLFLYQLQTIAARLARLVACVRSTVHVAASNVAVGRGLGSVVVVVVEELSGGTRAHCRRRWRVSMRGVLRLTVRRGVYCEP